MDSLTQIVLGAAVGEAVLGKKIGNRAMLWGAIGGTIPDLDVLSNIFYGEIPALLIHRGFMHSFVFAFIASPALALYARWFYTQNLYRKAWYKWIMGGIGIVLLTLIFLIFNAVYKIAVGRLSWFLIGLSILSVGYMTYRAYKRYASSASWDINASFKEWLFLFILSIGTHPILDCFTTYGTQILLPFTDHAVALNTISVADPFYTIPFGVSIAIAAFLTQGSKSRYVATMVGLIVSSLYLLLTVINKWQINHKFESAFAEHHVDYHRYMTAPTILQNFLWYGISESNDSYHAGYYTVFDQDGKIDTIHTLVKNHDLLNDHFEDPDIKTLQKFSKGYYNVFPVGDDTLQFNDLRYGTINGEFHNPKNYIFKFKLYKDGRWLVGESIDDRAGESESPLKDLVNNIKGYKD